MKTTDESTGRIEPLVVTIFEFSAMVSVHVVVAAKNEESAKMQVNDLTAKGWTQIGDIIGVSDIDVFDIRTCNPEHIDDLAHLKDLG
jgi:hypothetical protein